ncbi:Ig-like domain-containing protein [Tritonibacter scottomollicae]|uniref:Ig-like domain-containing protein n=1 Tax=Tritonibacter scottomollicae TaxID=483013 RepID=A0ABZ0HF98_TRISK|nr:Ig-like domain-containing protein [Tritonibacter scottomollicae]WOI33508.1 Ig-like domain-containing protein [Tritonibacter scottomollicae]
MSTVAFIARNPSGTNQHGTSAEGSPSVISTTGAKDISLNLDPTDVESYARRGNDLHITLSDGTIVELDGFYNTAATGPKNLFLSDEGDFIEVVLEDKADGMLFASYEPLDLSGKWSAYDDMVFLDVDRIEPVVAPLAAPLLGGLGGLGAAAAGAAVIAGAGGGGDGDGGGGGGDDGTGAIIPTVNDADGTYDVPEGDPDGVTISGTGETGSDVEVTIGDVVVTTTVNDDGTWSVNVPTDDLPDDGVYETVVDVVAPDGTTYDDLDGPTIDIDSEPPTVVITEGTQSVGDVVDGDEQASGTVITGTGEAGATVSLEIAGATQTTTVAEDGTWTVTFTPGEIATGEYETGITIVTTDPHGNSTTSSDVLEVDTETAVTIDTGLSGGDDIITAAEAAAGVAITGTAEAGASVEVTVEGVTRTTTANGDGTWSVTYEAGSLPDGEYDADISVTSTDAVGNTATATSTIEVDTDAGFVQLDEAPIEGDDIINHDERADGVTITGTATAGETVTVTLGGFSDTVIADADENWSLVVSANDIPEGTGNLDVTASISDDLGNTESDSDTVELDTVVENYESETLQTSDDVVNIDELAAGFTLAGTVEEGSTVTVEIDGTDYPASVDDDGNWSLTLDGDDLGTESREVNGTIYAEDSAGNVDDIPLNFRIDTDVDTPDHRGGYIEDGLAYSVTVSEETEELSVYRIDDNGSSSVIQGAPDTSPTGLPSIVFDDPIPDGTNLVIQETDDAGNRSSVLVIDQQSVSSDLLNSVGEHNIDTLDLVFEDNGNGANVTLTEEMINNMSSNSDTLVVRGDDNVGLNDDDNPHTVTLTGGVAAGTETVDGETFDVYTIGDGDTRLLVEDDVNVVI